MRRLINRKTAGEALRFGIVGVIATAVQYVTYILLLRIDMKAGIAFTIGYLVSWMLNFWLSSLFTFRSKATIRKVIGFAASHAVNYVLQITCLALFLALGCPKPLAPIPVWCICIPVNFLLVRLVFKRIKK